MTTKLVFNNKEDALRHLQRKKDEQLAVINATTDEILKEKQKQLDIYTAKHYASWSYKLFKKPCNLTLKNIARLVSDDYGWDYTPIDYLEIELYKVKALHTELVVEYNRI